MPKPRYTRYGLVLKCKMARQLERLRILAVFVSWWIFVKQTLIITILKMKLFLRAHSYICKWFLIKNMLMHHRKPKFSELFE